MYALLFQVESFFFSPLLMLNEFSVLVLSWLYDLLLYKANSLLALTHILDYYIFKIELLKLFIMW